MKLIYITNARIPTERANGYQVSKMCEAFGSSGWDTELWLPTRKSLIKADPFEFYKLKKTFKIKRIKCLDFIPLYRYLGNYSFLLQSLAFFIKLMFKRPDKKAIIYTRNPEIAWLFSRRGYRTFFEVHRWAETKSGLFKFFIKKTAGFITVTKYLKELAMKAGINEGSILVASDAVDLKIFDIDISKAEARARLNLPENKIILGYTGSFKTMGEEKGIADILKAMQILKNEKIIFLAVGGNKEDIDYYRRLARNLGVEKKALLLEKVSRQSLAVYQKACDLLLMPFPKTTHFSFFMSPLKMFEYMASRCPIVASDLPSIREVLGENSAVLIRPDNAENLARGLEYALADSERSRKISEQAHQDVLRYTWEKRAEKISNFIISGRQ